jgi:Uma2 family endonuclease
MRRCGFSARGDATGVAEHARRTKKLPAYAQMGVRHSWLVDPAAETLEVFRLEGLHWVLLGAHAGDDVVRAASFEEIALELRWLWGR